MAEVDTAAIEVVGDTTDPNRRLEERIEPLTALIPPNQDGLAVFRVVNTLK